MTSIRRVLDVAPHNARAHTKLATELSSRGQLDEAAKHYRKAVEIQSDNGQAREYLESALKQRDD